MNTDKNNKIRDLLSTTKIELNDNLKYRIMQQIVTEKSLASKKVQNPIFAIVKSVLPVLGGIYAVGIAICVGVYFLYGMEGLGSTTLYLSLALIGSIGLMYCLISAFDERINYKRKT